MQVPLVADLETLVVPCLAFCLRAALLLQHAFGICSLLVGADVTVCWLLSQLGLIDQIPSSSQNKEVRRRIDATYCA